MPTNKRNDTPEARGSADAYYGRQPDPHKYAEGRRILRADLTEVEVMAYMNAFDNEDDRKDWR